MILIIKRWFYSSKTSSVYTGGSTDATVNINLISKDGNASTGYFKLDHFWRNDFEKGKVDKFKKKTKDVGLPEVIEISKCPSATLR